MFLYESIVSFRFLSTFQQRLLILHLATVASCLVREKSPPTRTQISTCSFFLVAISQRLWKVHQGTVQSDAIMKDSIILVCIVGALPTDLHDVDILPTSEQ